MTRKDAHSREKTQPTSRTQEPPPTRKRILMLTPQFPYPPHQGTTMRNYNLIAELSQRHDVHLLSFGGSNESMDTPLHRLCDSVQVVPAPSQRSTRQRLGGLAFSRLPDMAQRLPSAQFHSLLAATLEREDPDVVEVEGIELAEYLFQVVAHRGAEKRPLLVFDDHNAEYVLQQRAFETDARSGELRRWAGAVYSFIQWRRLRTYERRACTVADRVVAVSETDAKALRDLTPGLAPSVVPNGVDMELYTAPISPHDGFRATAHDASPASPALGSDLVFTGKMDFRPNVDAVLWFAEHVLPQVRQEVPDARFWVVGKGSHPRLAPLADNPAVTVTGWVEDIRPYIAGATVYVIPLRIGGGTRLKVLEAMAMAKAIVSTSLGCEGFGLVPGQELVMADTPAEFAREVLGLLNDAPRRQELGRAARAFASSKYDWRLIVPRLEQVYGP
jgi:sugar transferase (PEP-CTERM/EpsH1 system associated)